MVGLHIQKVYSQKYSDFLLHRFLVSYSSYCLYHEPNYSMHLGTHKFIKLDLYDRWSI